MFNKFIMEIESLTTFGHLHRLTEPTIVRGNTAGDLAITEFLATEQLGSITQPITCTLYPRRRGTGEYIFEISPQLGCIVECPFCGCGEFAGNLSPEEVIEQINILQNDADDNGINVRNPKISFADGGELVLNPYCPQILEAIAHNFRADIKISSTLPGTTMSRRNLEAILEFAQRYYSENSNVAFQVSLSSTDPNIRRGTSRIPLLSFPELRTFGQRWTEKHPANRQITLTFTLTGESHCVASEIADELPPSLFIIRLHPYRPNGTGLTTINPDRCSNLEAEFVSKGYTVIREEFDQHELNQLITGGTNTIRERIIGVTSRDFIVYLNAPQCRS